MIGREKRGSIFIAALFFICVSIFNGTEVFAKQGEFRLDIDDLNLQKGVSTRLVLSILNEKKVDSIHIDGLENFEVLSKGNSTSTSIINGDSTYQKDIIYTIMPKKTGEFKLKGQVESRGKVYETNELSIKVQEKSASTEDSLEEVFIKTETPKEEIYFGEKIPLGYELFTRYNIENYGFREEFKIDGVLINDIPKDQLKANYEYINGKKYAKYEVSKMFISPTKTGDIKIPSYSFQVNLSTGDFFSSGKPVYLQTEEKDIKVNPLPLEGKPEGFSGVVGKLQVEGEYTRDQVDYGDSISLKVKVYGSCNLESLSSLVQDGIEGFSVYETEKNYKEDIVDGKYQGEKEFEIVLVPEETGKIEIAPIDIWYFDTESETYKKVEIPGTSIMVNGEIPEGNAGNFQEVKGEKVVISQVNYGASSGSEDGEYFTLRIKKSTAIYIAVGILVLIIIAIAVRMFILNRGKKDKKLWELYKNVKKSKDEKEAFDLFNEMIKYKLGISIKACSREEIIQKIQEKELQELVLGGIDSMEMGEKDIEKLKEVAEKLYKIMK